MSKNKGNGGPDSSQPAVQLTTHFGRKTRESNIVAGVEYIVEPLNPQKLKHRGRPCVVKGFVKDDIGTPTKARVQFLDNFRPGRVDIDDLKAPGMTKDRGVRATVAPIPAGPGIAEGGELKATLDVLRLEGDLEDLFQLVTKQLKKSEGATDPKVAAELLGTTVMMEGMGQILGVLARHVEEADVRQRLVHMAQRFGGYKGAMRNVTMATSNRIMRAKPKS